MIGWMRRLTVGQSLIALVLAGLSIALLFEISAFKGYQRSYRAIGQDRALIDATGNTGALVHELQRERSHSSAWITERSRRSEIGLLQQRLNTEEAIAALMAAHRQGGDPIPAGQTTAELLALSNWLDALRMKVDRGVLTPSRIQAEMAEQIDRLIAATAHSASTAKSIEVGLGIGSLATLMAAKNAVGLEQEQVAEILTRQPPDLLPLATMKSQLRERMLVRRTLMTELRMSANDELRETLDLLGVAPETRAVSHDRIRALTSGQVDGSRPWAGPGQFAANADARLAGLRGLERSGLVRLDSALASRAAAMRNKAILELVVLSSILMLLGSLATRAKLRVDRFMRLLSQTIRSLSGDPQGATIPQWSRTDMNQIAKALAELKTSQVERLRTQEIALETRNRVDEKLSLVLSDQWPGRTRHRIDLLGLDAHGAVLARGINRLLDQIEFDHGSAKPQKDGRQEKRA